MKLRTKIILIIGAIITIVVIYTSMQEPILSYIIKTGTTVIATTWIAAIYENQEEKNKQ